MCNHYRTDPDKIPSWRDFAGFDIRQPNAAFATDVWPKKPGMIVRNDDGGIQSDVMSWGVPTHVKGKSGKMLEKRVTNVRNLSSPFWKSMLANPLQRCLVPFSTFAEPKIGEGRDEWWFNVIDQPIAAFAGIWRQSDDGPVYAFLTCEPNALALRLEKAFLVGFSRGMKGGKNQNAAPAGSIRSLTAGFVSLDRLLMVKTSPAGSYSHRLQTGHH